MHYNKKVSLTNLPDSISINIKKDDKNEEYFKNILINQLQTHVNFKKLKLTDLYITKVLQNKDIKVGKWKIKLDFKTQKIITFANIVGFFSKLNSYTKKNIFLLSENNEAETNKIILENCHSYVFNNENLYTTSFNNIISKTNTKTNRTEIIADYSNFLSTFYILIFEQESLYGVCLDGKIYALIIEGKNQDKPIEIFNFDVIFKNLKFSNNTLYAQLFDNNTNIYHNFVEHFIKNIIKEKILLNGKNTNYSIAIEKKDDLVANFNESLIKNIIKVNKLGLEENIEEIISKNILDITKFLQSDDIEEGLILKLEAHEKSLNFRDTKMIKIELFFLHNKNVYK